MKKELEALKSKIAVLEAKIKELESRQTIHNHYHAHPNPWAYQPLPFNPWLPTQPYFGDPNYRVMCIGTGLETMVDASTVTVRTDNFAVN